MVTGGAEIPIQSRRRTVKSTPLFKCASIAALCVMAALTARSAQAQTYKVLYSFCSADKCTDGANPEAGVIQDSQGNLYGTTAEGGDACGTGSCGTVFKLDKTGRETVLYRFKFKDGANPEAGLIQDADGNLYGTTFYGGHGESAEGTVFKLSKTGDETVLHTFTGGADGGNPEAGVIRDAEGNLYGTADFGGQGQCKEDNACGVIFRISGTGKETVLYSFAGGNDGGNPDGGLLRDAEGNFFGDTSEGTVFKLSKTYKETVLYHFSGGHDGGIPVGGVIEDAEGNLYGATATGGTGCFDLGCGTVFKVDKWGKETVLYRFTGKDDGSSPRAGVIGDAEGNLYGTAVQGGDLSCGSGDGCGVVFKLSKTGKETVLHAFEGTGDGEFPEAGLIRDSKGNLYGTTSYGGGTSSSCLVYGPGCGVVFEVTP